MRATKLDGVLICTAILLLVGIASAQQPPGQCPEVDPYRQLLTEANDRVAQLGGQNVKLVAQVKALQAELEAAKKAGEKPQP